MQPHIIPDAPQYDPILDLHGIASIEDPEFMPWSGDIGPFSTGVVAEIGLLGTGETEILPFTAKIDQLHDITPTPNDELAFDERLEEIEAIVNMPAPDSTRAKDRSHYQKKRFAVDVDRVPRHVMELEIERSETSSPIKTHMDNQAEPGPIVAPFDLHLKAYDAANAERYADELIPPSNEELRFAINLNYLPRVISDAGQEESLALAVENADGVTESVYGVAMPTKQSRTRAVPSTRTTDHSVRMRKNSVEAKQQKRADLHSPGQKMKSRDSNRNFMTPTDRYFASTAIGYDARRERAINREIARVVRINDVLVENQSPAELYAVRLGTTVEAMKLGLQKQVSAADVRELEAVLGADTAIDLLANIDQRVIQYGLHVGLTELESCYISQRFGKDALEIIVGAQIGEVHLDNDTFVDFTSIPELREYFGTADEKTRSQGEYIPRLALSALANFASGAVVENSDIGHAVIALTSALGVWEKYAGGNPDALDAEWDDTAIIAGEQGSREPFDVVLGHARGYRGNELPGGYESPELSIAMADQALEGTAYRRPDDS